MGGKTSGDYGVLRNLGVAKIAKRQSFIIDPDGMVVRHYEKVDPETHTQEVLEDLKKLMGAG